MFGQLILFLCVTTILSNPLTTKIQNNGPRIIGGQIASAGQFPFLAAINIRTNNGQYFCGGALLTRQWVITAGHCVDGALLFNVQLGSDTLNATDPNLIQVSTDSYILHPDYNPDTLANDIGLIEFRLPITYTDYIKPINLLPATDITPGSPLLTMGWGQISDDDAGLQSRVHWVSVTTMLNEECMLVYGNQILDTMTCAEGNYNEGTCYGDTGGPLIQYASRGQIMHVGISSFISQNGCESTDPSGYTRTFEYVDWIKNITGFF